MRGHQMRQPFRGTEWKEEVTWSKLILMLPTFVAPTGIMLKNPCLHRPSMATRSLRTNRFSRRFATYGETENSSPATPHV